MSTRQARRQAAAPSGQGKGLTVQDALTMWKRAKADSVWFIETTFGDVVHDLQNQICRSVERNPITLVKTCHATGKTRIAAGIASWWCSTDTDRMVITTATTATQSKQSLWREIAALAENAKKRGRDTGAIPLQAEARWEKLRSVAFARTVPQGRADDVAATMFQGMRGANGTLIIIDEATAISSGVFLGATAILTGVNDRLLVMCNPTDGASHVARMFKDPTNARLTMSAFDSPNIKPFGVTPKHIASGEWKDMVPPEDRTPFKYLINAHWVAKRWSEFTDNGLRPNDPRWLGRIMAEFPTQGDDVLVPQAWIDAAVALYTGKSLDAREYGIDVADGGDDSSAIAERRGPQVRIADKVYGLEAEETGRKALELLRGDTKVPVRVDGDGIGATVYGILVGQRYSAAARVHSGKPPDDANVSRAELEDLGIRAEQFDVSRSLFWWMVRQRFKHSYQLWTTGTCDGPHIELEPNPAVETQIGAIKWEQKGGKICVEKKPVTKKRLNGKSPDEADAIMYAFVPGKKRSFFL